LGATGSAGQVNDLFLRAEEEIMKIRDAVKLTSGLERKLMAYATAASAAGVALAGLTPAAEAEVVYTPVDKTIRNHRHFNLDLNHDSITDFVLNNGSFQSSSIRGSWLSAQAGASNGVAGYANSFSWASALKVNQRVGAKKSFVPGNAVMAFLYMNGSASQTFGQWGDRKKRYLGLEFTINGKIHYGWARLTVTVDAGSVKGRLTGYAYETKAGKAILAGDEGTRGLGRLALGAAGRQE
jgi:hypothetical protein